MASFSAFLNVLRERYALRDSCTGFEQAVHWRTGFPRAKVTNRVMVLEILVQEGAAIEKLVAYAASDTKTEDGWIDYLRTDLEGTDHHWWFKRAYCVGLLFGFNSLGLDGQPATRIWVALSPAEQGYARGSGAPFVLPTGQGYEYRPAKAAWVPPVAPTPPNIPIDLAGKKPPKHTPEGKAWRWARYQRDNASNPDMWSYERWEKQYNTNHRNAEYGLAREAEYAAVMGGVSKTLKTDFTHRQVDIFIKDQDYCGQLKTGKVSLTKQAKLDVVKDKWLVERNYQVEYILEKGASQPMLDALKEIGASVKIGPQIPPTQLP